jgi:hypothetical protein
MYKKVDKARQDLCRDFIGLSPPRRARVVLDAQKLASQQVGRGDLEHSKKHGRSKIWKMDLFLN